MCREIEYKDGNGKSIVGASVYLGGKNLKRAYKKGKLPDRETAKIKNCLEVESVA